MLISIRHNFVFIANLKTASTSIEAVLRPFSDITNTYTATGKHDGYQDIARKFSWLFEKRPLAGFCIFGVVRHPVDYVLSVYNSHAKAAFDGKPASTRNIPFDKYWYEGHDTKWQLTAQSARFLDADGKVAADYVIDFATVSAEFRALLLRMKVKGDLGHLNESPSVVTRRDLSATTIRSIEDAFAADMVLLASRPRSFDKILARP
jgi:hypothetical protein